MNDLFSSKAKFMFAKNYIYKMRVHLYIVIGSSFLIFTASVTIGQELPAQVDHTPAGGNIPIEYLRRARGELLSKGKNSIPTGKLKVKTYRLEEIRLPEPIEVTSGISHLRIESALRLTVTLNTYLNENYSIWVGDDFYRAAPTRTVPLPQDNELSVIVFGPMLQDDATIQVVTGTSCTTSDQLSILPERLRVPSRLRPPEKKEHFEGISLKIRRDTSSDATLDRPDVIVEITRPPRFDLSRNQIMVAQVGRQEFYASPRTPQTLELRMTAEQFARAKDGDLIRIKYGFCSPGGLHVGRLDKSLLDQ